MVQCGCKNDQFEQLDSKVCTVVSLAAYIESQDSLHNTVERSTVNCAQPPTPAGSTGSG
jgi:hypothetical protein